MKWKKSLSASEAGASFPARGTWIEMLESDRKYMRPWSFPARGTWIEIHWCALRKMQDPVVPREGNVD